MQSIELENRKKIIYKYLENPHVSASSIAKELTLNARTCQKVIKRYKDSMTIERKAGSGRKSGPVDCQLANKVIKSFKENPGLSLRDRAIKYKTSKSNVHRLRRRSGLKCYRAIKHPNRTEKQNLTAKKRARKLYDEVLRNFNGCIVMDDETYIKCDFKQVNGQKFYLSTMRGNVPEKFKYVCLDKFARKMMVWQAICSCGRKSQAYVTSSTMKADNYIKECLQKRLLPFIKSHTVPVRFWPDLASCHYARTTMAWFEANRVAVVQKNMNPPNCPELRPIEKYWAIVKRYLKKNGGTVNDAKTMLRKWNQQAEKVQSPVVKRLMGGINGKVSSFFSV